MSKIRFSYAEESETESREDRARERDKARKAARAFKLEARSVWIVED